MKAGPIFGTAGSPKGKRKIVKRISNGLDGVIQRGPLRRLRTG